METGSHTVRIRLLGDNMDIFLHEGQSIVDADDHRFQVVAAGRRFGKSFYAAYRLYEAASHETKVRTD